MDHPEPEHINGNRTQTVRDQTVNLVLGSSTLLGYPKI